LGFGGLSGFQTLGFLFVTPLLLLDLTCFSFLTKAGFLELALAPLHIFALARLNQRPRPCIHFASRKLTQDFLRTLFGLALIWGRFLEGAMLHLRRYRFRLVRGLFRQALARQRALALRFYENGFRPAMREVLADMALLHCPLRSQRYGLPAGSRLIFRFFRFAHSLSWRRGVSATSPAQ
jgi:hypothetical protein